MLKYKPDFSWLDVRNSKVFGKVEVLGIISQMTPSTNRFLPSQGHEVGMLVIGRRDGKWFSTSLRDPLGPKCSVR